MFRVFGPVVTTGAALVVAGVVVANPVTAPRPDVQIPSVQLSNGTDETGGMLDKAFLDAIAPAPPESGNPFMVLRQLIASLAADATFMGKNALVDAFVAGVAVVSGPDLTAASAPYPLPEAEPTPLIASVLPGIDIPLPSEQSPVDIPRAVAEVADLVTGAVTPAVRDLVTALVQDVSYVSRELVSAAFAVGAVVAAEPAMIVATLGALVKGDLQAALTNAVKVVTAPFGPPAMVVNALRNVVETRLATLPVLSPSPSAVPAGAADIQPPAVTVDVTISRDIADRPARRPRPAVQPVEALTALTSASTPDSVSPSAAVAVAGALNATQIRGSATESAETTSPAPIRRPARDTAKVPGGRVATATRSTADSGGTESGSAVGRASADG